jgi:YVTN family beta-propeller protein
MWRMIRSKRSARRPLLALILLAAGVAGLAGPAAGAAAAPRPASAHPGTNLIRNPGAQAGAASVQGWDSVTIPGWQIERGLPTVVRYGTRGFPAVSGRAPAVRGGQLLVGGVGGTALLGQDIALRAPDGRAVPPGTRFELSGWLGGSRASRASLTVAFLSATGRVVGRSGLRPAGRIGTRKHPGLVFRSDSAVLPRGTVRARLTLSLASSLKGADGPHGPLTGYNRAIADGLRFAVGAPVRRAVLRPPAARVPRYQHVFLFYFENQDFRSLVGDTARAPYLNRLMHSGSLLASTFAEEHPSDGNYLALAGGSVFGVPLTDPAEENPLYTIRARSIASLLDAAHESWKGYLQSAAGPCDDTVHGSYWDDDLPLMYFASIRDRPRYCAAHVVPLEQLTTDLSRAASTPRFAWIGPNDCTDMEGCGVRAGDRFLASELGAILRSPAWRTQRSLAIITVDEDAYNHPDPPQRVATLVLGSRGVRAGYVSRVRYTHYSLLRTIEAALGLGTLTANDRYAQPVNDVFRRGARMPSLPPARRARAGSGRVAARPAARAHRQVAGPAAGGARQGRAAFVVNSGSGTVTPVNLRTRRAGPPIRVGARPTAIVASPDGRVLYVADSGAGTVTPVSAVTRRAGPPIRVGRDPRALAITPDGRTLYVANSGSGTVTPVSTRTGRAGRPIPVGRYPRSIAMSSDGRTAYVLDWGSGQITPVSVRHNRAGRPIRVGAYPVAATFAPGGRTLYVASYGADTVTPVDLRTGRAGRPVLVGAAPDALAVTRDGRTVYAVSGDTSTVTPIRTAAWRPGRPVRVGYSPAAIGLSASGTRLYVVGTISGTVTPIGAADGRRDAAIPVGLYSYPTAIGMDPAGPLAVVLGTYGGTIRLIDTRTDRASRAVRVGSGPVAVAFGG